MGFSQKQSHFIGLFWMTIILFLLSSCDMNLSEAIHSPATTTSTNTHVPSTPTQSPTKPTSTPNKTPTHTPDVPQTPNVDALKTAATIFMEDFENGYPPGLLDWSQRWYLEKDIDGNSIFCSEISDEWSLVTFGLNKWEDYAFSLSMKFPSYNKGQGAETLIRIKQWGEGYRVSLFNKWAGAGYFPPYSSLGEYPISINQEEWFRVQLQFAGSNMKYFLDDELLIAISDETRTSGLAGFSAAPNTEVCIDDIHVWGLDKSGNPVDGLDELVIPFDGKTFTLLEKIDNKPTVPVFYPWPHNCDQKMFDFDCDSSETPYSLLWTSSGRASDLESTEAAVPYAQSLHMRSDPNTIYLISEEWHYWWTSGARLSPDSKFFLDEVFNAHLNSEYTETKVINFEHPEWPGVLAEKALGFKNAGFDGIMFDWWHNGAGNGRPLAVVEAARTAISKAIREKVGPDFVLMGNVGWSMYDPTSQYLSGVFLELGKPSWDDDYALTYNDEPNSAWSIERMEDILKYWNANLQWPKIIAMEPQKITRDDYITDRYSEENYELAKLFAAMALVIPDNGYILYADNNYDWDGWDHEHAYYDFYLTDFGKPTSGMIEVSKGVAYKQFERGIIAYNRTLSDVEISLSSDKKFRIGPIEGLFLSNENLQGIDEQ